MLDSRDPNTPTELKGVSFFVGLQLQTSEVLGKISFLNFGKNRLGCWRRLPASVCYR